MRIHNTAQCTVHLNRGADPGHFGVDPDPDLDSRIHASDKWIRILLFSSLTFKMPTKNKFF